MDTKSIMNIVDYIGNSYNSEPIGHPVKVITQVQELLKDEYTVNTVLPVIYDKTFHIDFKLLKYCDISEREKKFYKLQCFMKKLQNLRSIFKTCEGTLFFVNTDIVLYLFLLLTSRKRKVVVISFCNYLSMSGLTGNIKKIIFKLANTKINLQLNTYNLESNEFIPDYYYNPNKAINKLKSNNIDFLVIGTMNEAKDLVGIIEAVKGTKHSLKIIGKFYSDLYYKEILSYITGCSNITIVNKYLENDEYINEITNANYVVLPYKVDIYNNMTSGVFLDAVYNNTPIICPSTPYFNQFKSMNIGIVYNNLNEVIDVVEKTDYNSFATGIEAFNRRNSEEVVKMKLISLLSENT